MNRCAMDLEFGVPYHRKTIDQCRVIGARGGRRSGMVRRARQMGRITEATTGHSEPRLETVHEACLLLDEQFPHLRNAWSRTARRPAA